VSGRMTIYRIGIFTSINQARCRDDVVPAYAEELRAWWKAGYPSFDWSEINRAIIDKWSPAALEYIKDRAWRQFYGERPA